MRVLIFGATGRFGSAVMRAAIAAGHECVAVNSALSSTAITAQVPVQNETIMCRDIDV